MRRRTESDFALHAAGRLWNAGEVEITELPDGTLAVSAAELSRIHLAVANEICGRDSALTAEELEFLVDVADSSYAQLARELDVDRSTITVWRRKGKVPRRPMSALIKKWAWFRLFGESLSSKSVKLGESRDTQVLLDIAHDKAIHEQVTFAVQ